MRASLFNQSAAAGVRRNHHHPIIRRHYRRRLPFYWFQVLVVFDVCYLTVYVVYLYVIYRKWLNFYLLIKNSIVLNVEYFLIIFCNVCFLIPFLFKLKLIVISQSFNNQFIPIWLLFILLIISFICLFQIQYFFQVIQ